MQEGPQPIPISKGYDRNALGMPPQAKGANGQPGEQPLYLYCHTLSPQGLVQLEEGVEMGGELWKHIMHSLKGQVEDFEKFTICALPWNTTFEK